MSDKRGSPGTMAARSTVHAPKGAVAARRAADRPAPGPAWTSSDTVYLAAADRHGNMVSLINSIAGVFGSGVVVPGAGVLLQNRGAGFTLEDGLPNTVAPRKRPFHTIAASDPRKDGMVAGH